MDMYTAAQARERQADLLEQVRKGQHPLVTRWGKPAMRCVPEDWYQNAKQMVEGLGTLAGLLHRDPEELRAMSALLETFRELPQAG